MKAFLSLGVLTFCLATFGGDRSSPVPLKLGVIGCDTLHSYEFARILNSSEDPAYHGHRIVAAYKWGSRDIPLCLYNYKEYLPKIERLGVEMVSSVEALLEKVDAVFLETCDGRLHYDQALQVFRSGKRVFIDKPLAENFTNVVKIVRAARETGASFFCSSGLRYVDNVQRAARGEFGAVRGADLWTPERFEPSHSDYYWYAIHGAEPLFAIMGRGCVDVTAVRTGTEDMLVGRWKDGRIGAVRAMQVSRKGAVLGGTVYLEKGRPVDIGGYPGFESLLKEIIRFFETGVVPVSSEESLEIYAFLAAAAESARRGGVPVELSKLIEQGKD